MSSTTVSVFPELDERQCFQDEKTGEFWFHATGVCHRMGFKNVSSAVQLHTDEDERRQEVLNGRAVWFVSEAGIWGLALGSKAPEAKAFKRRLKHEILPKLRKTELRKTGMYAAPTRFFEEESNRLMKVIEDRDRRILRLEGTNKVLLENRNLTQMVQDFIRCNLIYKKGGYIESQYWVKRFAKWVSFEQNKHRYAVLRPQITEVLVEMDRLFKADPQPKEKRFYIDVEGEWGDIENAKLRSSDETFHIFTHLSDSPRFYSNVVGE